MMKILPATSKSIFQTRMINTGKKKRVFEAGLPRKSSNTDTLFLIQVPLSILTFSRHFLLTPQNDSQNSNPVQPASDPMTASCIFLNIFQFTRSRTHSLQTHPLPVGTNYSSRSIFDPCQSFGPPTDDMAYLTMSCDNHSLVHWLLVHSSPANPSNIVLPNYSLIKVCKNKTITVEATGKKRFVIAQSSCFMI